MTPMTSGSCVRRGKTHTWRWPQPGPVPRASRVQTTGPPDLALPCRSAPGASAKHILDDISIMFDALADQLDAMLD